MLSSADGTVTVRRSREDDALGLRERQFLEGLRVHPPTHLLTNTTSKRARCPMPTRGLGDGRPIP